MYYSDSTVTPVHGTQDWKLYSNIKDPSEIFIV